MNKNWEEKLRKDMISHSYSIHKCMCYFLHSTHCLLEIVYNYYDIDRTIKEEHIAGLFVDFYNSTIDVKSIKEIDEILNTDTMLTLAVKNQIIGSKHNYISKEMVYFEGEIPIKEDYIKFSDRAIIELFIDSSYVTEFSYYLEQLYKKSTTRAAGLGIMIGAAICYIKAMIKCIFLISNYSNLITQNDDLLIMYQNLIYNRNTPISTVDALEKIYSIYQDLYENKFDHIMRFEEFGVILYSSENDIYFQNHNYFTEKIYEDVRFFAELIPCYTGGEPLIDTPTVAYIASEHTNKNYDKNDKDTLYIDAFEQVIICLITYYIDQIDIFKFIKIISSLKSCLIEYNKETKKTAALKERDRLLHGDLSIELEQTTDNDLFENIQTGEEFELYLAKLYENLGYEVFTTSKTRDQGADLVIIKNNKKAVVQAKHYSTPVGNKAVQECVGAIRYYSADKAIVITNSTFTKSAIELAKYNDVELIDGNALNMLRKCAFGY